MTHQRDIWLDGEVVSLGESNRDQWDLGWGAPFTFLHAGTCPKRTGSFEGAGVGGRKRSRLGNDSPFVVK